MLDTFVHMYENYVAKEVGHWPSSNSLVDVKV